MRVLARHERCERPTVRLLARAGVRLLARVGVRVLARHERPPFCLGSRLHSFLRLLACVRWFAISFVRFLNKVNISTTKTIVKSVIAIFAPKNEVPNARQLKCRQSNPHFHLEGSCTSQGTKDCQMLNSYAVQTTGKMTCVL